ncbi:MAG TPA: hypothetical protein VFU88_15820 [Ktedonobacterales bacterium]|nr:hypothetical protein [Ktedonobacterales bacterium]
MATEGASAPRTGGRARVVALTQEHRGHGVSTAAYYLGRVLVAQGLRVLLVDVTDRHARVMSLIQRGPVKNLVFWAPQSPRPQEVASLVERARAETAGKADVILLDIDAAMLARAGVFAVGLDYIVVITEPAETGLRNAERVAERLGPSSETGRVGVVYARVDAQTAADLPAQSEQRHLPVLGHYPADYLLAGGDAYSLKGSAPSAPHDTYLFALMRLGQRLTQLVPLTRATRMVGMETHLPPHESNEQPLV